MASIQGIEFNIEVWKEGDIFVSHIPQLNVASCGESVEEARSRIKEALELFLDEARKKGTLELILQEAGFEQNKKKLWQAPKILSFERFKMTV